MGQKSKKHIMSGRFRPTQDPWHWQFWAGHVGPTQGKQGPLCHENFGQTKGGEVKASGAHLKRKKDSPGDFISLSS
jgi:hypothetical protein